MEPKEKRKSPVRCAPVLRTRAVRIVLEHADDHTSQRAAVGSIAVKIGYTAERYAAERGRRA
jgi:transposase